MSLQPDNPYEVDSTVTEGAGIPAPDLDRLIAATVPDDDEPVLPSAFSFSLSLAEAAMHARYVAEDIEGAFEVMPGDTAIGVGLDLVNAQAHISTAQRLIADAIAVTR